MEGDGLHIYCLRISWEGNWTFVYFMIDVWVIVCRFNNYFLNNGVHATFLEIIVLCYGEFHCSTTLPPHMDVQHWLVTSKLNEVPLNQVLNTTDWFSVGHFNNIKKTSSLQVNCITRYMLSLMGWTKELCLLLIWCEIFHVWLCPSLYG